MTNRRQINPSSASCFCQYVLSQGQEMKLSQRPKDLASRSSEYTIYTAISSWFMDLPPFCTSACQISLETSQEGPGYLHLLTLLGLMMSEPGSQEKMCMRTDSPGAVWPLRSAYPFGIYQCLLKTVWIQQPSCYLWFPLPLFQLLLVKKRE